MSDAVIAAIIAGVCAVIGQLLISRAQTKTRKVEEAVRDQRQEDRLARIEEQLRIHNSYAERFADIQTDIAVIKNDIKTLYKQKSE